MLDVLCCLPPHILDGWPAQEKLYVELKKILGRQPGPEVSEQLAVYQDNLKHKVCVKRMSHAPLALTFFLDLLLRLKMEKLTTKIVFFYGITSAIAGWRR